MSPSTDLLKAIADAGGLDPIDVLRHLVDITTPEDLLHMDGGLFAAVLRFLQGNVDERQAAVIKGILWDARIVASAARDVSTEEKTRRLELLDRVGRLLFPPASGHGCRVELRASDLNSAVQVLNVAQPAGTVRVSFAGRELRLSRGRTSVGIPAAGEWPRTAVVGGQLVADLLDRHHVFPEELVVSGSDTRLHFSHYSIRCRWEVGNETGHR